MRGQIPVAHVVNHIRAFFAGHVITEDRFNAGPMPSAYPEFRVLTIAPGPRIPLWTYVSAGTCQIGNDDAEKTEFSICAPSKDDRLLEIVTMTGWYHHSMKVGRGHIIPIGEPWLPGSSCDNLLVSLPYPFGPDLEICNYERQHLHILWLVPITTQECLFAKEHGAETLEERFDAAQLESWSPRRASVA